MKTKPKMDPAAAFPDAAHPPSQAELAATLALAAPPLDAVLTQLRALKPATTTTWLFSDRVGWHQIVLLKVRRLFYLVPQRGDFRLSLILGGKALAQLEAGPFARRTAKLLATAKHYPEGTAFSFDRRSIDPDLVVALLEAKIAH